MAVEFTGGRVRFFRNFAEGALEPLASGQVFFYEAGTSDPKDTFTTSDGDIANPNPVPLDSEGYATIFLGTGKYKVDVQDSLGNSLPGYPIDDIEGTTLILDTITAESSTTVAIGTGSKSFTIEANKSFPENGWVLISYDVDPTNNYMVGQVTDYTGTTITIDVTQFEGSGTYNDWTIALSGPPGPEGSQGPAGAGTGDMLKSENLSGLTDVAAARGNLGLGSAAVLDAGTGPNQVLQLDSSGNIPAIDGANITNLDAGNVATGTISTARLGSGTADSTTFLRGDQTWAVPGLAAYGAVGSYTKAYTNNASGTIPGGTVSGSSLRSGINNTGATSLSGTWRNMDVINGNTSNKVIFLRIA